MKQEIVCAICGNRFQGERFDDCPICEWGFTGIEKDMDEDEKDGYNGISIATAKLNFAKGLNVWGEPLKKVSFSSFETPKN